MQVCHNAGVKHSFGKSTLEPPCSKIECGEYECPIPFELKTASETTVCNIMFGPDKCGYNTRTHVIFNYKSKNALMKNALSMRRPRSLTTGMMSRTTSGRLQ